MATVTWSLEARGRLRPKAYLVDEDGRDVARVVRDGRVAALRAGGATDADGRSWRVVGPSDDLRVSCDGSPLATVRDGVLEVGGRAFGWLVAEDGSRSARVTSAASGGTVLRVERGDGPAWARIAIDDDLPEAFGIVLAVCVRLLEAEDPHWVPGRAGAGGRKGPAGREARAASSGRTGGAAGDPAGGDLGGGDARTSTGEDADAPAAASPDRVGAPETAGRPAEEPPRDGAPATTWALYVRGRARPRIVLSDGGTEPLATIDVRGGPAGSLGTATDHDGRRWVAELDGGVVTVRCAGRAMARAEGQELTIGGRTFAWRASLEGERTAAATDDDGRDLLRVTRGGGGDEPWVVVELDDALPSPLAATLATLFVLLRVDALGRRG